MSTENKYNHYETLACLIIDDPLLIPQYGRLNYKRLLEEMKRHNFFTEIAFIPWNYKRSNDDTVRLFIDNLDRFAICVHGCNHTRNEFGINDYKTLKDLSYLALWRMEQHTILTGLSYDPVMVFPQGRFSSTAMKALKGQGYFAAFNSTLKATDGNEPSYSEYLKPATTFFHEFPLFLRRYPNDKSGFIRDFEAGRPLIIVEHAGVFKAGYKTITDLVDWINGLGNIRWCSLKDIVEHYLATTATFPHMSTAPSRSMGSFNFKITLRRCLSELRDQYIETNDAISKIYKFLRS